ncbi:MAG: 50S ribosomal protein L2 [Candidatus Pacearchaeota archaeon]
MGKSIISQARGHGSMTYRVRRKAFSHKIAYPNLSGDGEVVKLISSAGHSAPIAKIKVGDSIFYNPASKNLYEGQKIKLGEDNNTGSIMPLREVQTKIKVFNIESKPGDGGKFIRGAGGSAEVLKKEAGKVTLLFPSKKEKVFNDMCRATIGVVAGHGRVDKPIVKAGKQFYIKKAKSKLWPRTSAVKVNAIDHPFGSGRGKNLTHGGLGKIPRRNAPPGAKVGSIRASRTGKKRGGDK